MMHTETIHQDNAAVVITEQGGAVRATFWVNARHGIADATITQSAWKGRTLAGARRWAKRKLAIHTSK